MPRKGAGIVDTIRRAFTSKEKLAEEEAALRAKNQAEVDAARMTGTLGTRYATPPATSQPPSSSSAFSTGRPAFSFAGRRTSMRKAFDRCVKSVRKTVKARKGSTKESAAIAICTKSVLQTRGRTLKRYRKGHLKTQPAL